MKLLGQHIISNLISPITAFETTVISDKLNIPTRESVVQGPGYGDVFVRYDDFFFMNNYTVPINLVSKINSDIIKSVIVGEILTEDYLNYDNTSPDLFFATYPYTEIDIKVVNADATVFNATVLDVNLSDLTCEINLSDADLLYPKLEEYRLNNVPVRVELYLDDTSLIDTVLNSIYALDLVDTTTLVISGLLLNTDITTILSINKLDIDHIDIEVANESIPRRILPHVHELDELLITVNDATGFVKAEDGTIDIGTPITIKNVEIIDIGQTGYIQDSTETINKSDTFLLQNISEISDSTVNYDTTIVYLVDSSRFEYEFIDIEININNTERLYINSKAYLEEYQNTFVVDSTNYLTKYLCKYSNFNNTNSTQAISYEYVDMTSISDHTLVGDTIKILLKFYEIEIIQPIITNIPYAIITATNRAYDYVDNKYLIRRPKTIPNIQETINLTLTNPKSKLNFTFDSTDLSVEVFEIYYDGDVSVSTVNTGTPTVLLGQGNFKLVPNTTLNPFHIIMV